MLLPLLLLVLGLLGGVVDAQPEYRVPAHTTPFWDQLFFDTEVSPSHIQTDGALSQPHILQFTIHVSTQFPPLLRCGSKLPLCAWAGKLAPSDLTQVAPEPNSISQGTVLLMHGPDDTTGAYVLFFLHRLHKCMHTFIHSSTNVNPEYRIRGEYPRVRFFSFQTYDYPGVQVR